MVLACWRIAAAGIESESSVIVTSNNGLCPSKVSIDCNHGLVPPVELLLLMRRPVRWHSCGILTADSLEKSWQCSPRVRVFDMVYVARRHFCRVLQYYVYVLTRVYSNSSPMSFSSCCTQRRPESLPQAAFLPMTGKNTMPAASQDHPWCPNKIPGVVKLPVCGGPVFRCICFCSSLRLRLSLSR